jgi:PPM family protein phosphatase
MSTYEVFMSEDLITTTLSARTDIGLMRENNEDMFIMAEPESGTLLDNNQQLVRSLEANSLLLVVSDGMGGHEGGEVASLLTVGTIKLEIAKLPPQLSPISRLEAAVEEANRTVWQERKVNARLSEMGATATAVLVEQDIAYVAEVGDSRAYIIRDGRIKQLTTDQTMVQVLIDSGVMTPEAAERSKNRNVLLQAVGTQEFLQIAVTSIQLQINDIILLCSDGLSGKVKANEMKAIIEANTSLDAGALALIDLAKERGGDDNITIVLAKFEGNGLKTRVRSGTTLTKQIKVLARYDPEQEAQAKPRREVRPALFEDWCSSAVIDAFARTEEQRQALSQLENFGEYVVFRKGDLLVSQRESALHDHYWLISGRYRIYVDNPNGEKQTVALLVAPTDRRSDDEIQDGEPLIRVKRQFFTPTIGGLLAQYRDPVISCEDEENAAIRISEMLFQQIAEILGERYTTFVKYS